VLDVERISSGIEGSHEDWVAAGDGDSYICGYWCGLRDAKYLMEQKSKKGKSGAVKPS
jgi:hypothetical protein